MKNIAQTVDAEPVESRSYLALSYTPPKIKPDRSDAEDWVRWLVFLLMPEGIIFPAIEDADLVRCANMDNCVLAIW